MTKNNVVEIEAFGDTFEVEIREYDGQRVVTFDMIDVLHNKAEEVAHNQFLRNKKHMIEGIDYYEFKGEKGREALSRLSFSRMLKLNNNPNFRYYLLTETGYLMLVKSFRDDLAWSIQRQLVNTYFKAKTNDLVPEKIDANVFQLFRKMVDQMENDHRAVTEALRITNEHAEKLDAIENRAHSKPEEGALQLKAIAAQMKLFSKRTNEPHSSFVGAIARECGIRTSTRILTSEQRDYQVIIWDQNGIQTPTLFIKKAGIDKIKTWWQKNAAKYHFVDKYKRNYGEHKIGDIRRSFYRIGNTEYELDELLF